MYWKLLNDRNWFLSRLKKIQKSSKNDAEDKIIHNIRIALK